ncbi:MAG: NmrA family NAD(P)-binding protein [Gemmatimonadales bacterium]
MKVLVTGGTGVVGQAAVTELVRRGHSVRLLTRNALKAGRALGGCGGPGARQRQRDQDDHRCGGRMRPGASPCRYRRWITA